MSNFNPEVSYFSGDTCAGVSFLQTHFYNLMKDKKPDHRIVVWLKDYNEQLREYNAAQGNLVPQSVLNQTPAPATNTSPAIQPVSAPKTSLSASVRNTDVVARNYIMASVIVAVIGVTLCYFVCPGRNEMIATGASAAVIILGIATCYFLNKRKAKILDAKMAELSKNVTANVGTPVNYVPASVEVLPKIEAPPKPIAKPNIRDIPRLTCQDFVDYCLEEGNKKHELSPNALAYFYRVPFIKYLRLNYKENLPALRKIFKCEFNAWAREGFRKHMSGEETFTVEPDFESIMNEYRADEEDISFLHGIQTQLRQDYAAAKAQ